MIHPAYLRLSAIFSLSATILFNDATSKVAASPSPCTASTDPYKMTRVTLMQCNVATFPLQAVRVLPDGGKAYVYDLHGHTMTFTVPPPGFDPLHATNAQLHYYSMPARPTSPTELLKWQTLVKGTRWITPPPYLAEVHNVSFGHIHTSPTEPIGTSTVASTSPNWGGYEATSTYNQYTQIQSTWNEPAVPASQPCTNNAIALFGGIGGDEKVGGPTGANFAQIGTAPKVPGTTIGNHQAFFEVEPDMGNRPTALPVYATPNYDFTMSLQWNGYGTYYGFAKNTYTNAANSFQDSTSTYNGYSAEFILDRPYNTTGNYFYTLSQWQTPYYGNQVFFGSNYVNGTAASNAVGNYPTEAITMQNSLSQSLTHPGSLWNSNLSFYMYFDRCG